MKRTIPAVALMVGLLAACDDPNPLIGKWKASSNSTDKGACAMLGTVEFTEKVVMTSMLSSPVAYSRDGTRYVAAMGGGGWTFIFEKAGNELAMFSPFKCQMLKV